jgi:hypothetical protein
MGYRSEVAYVIGFDTKERREEFVALIRVRGDELWTALQECGIEEGRTRINFYASDVKWYESYPDVKMHDRLLEFISKHYDDGDGIGWKFIRVGEEHGDVDEQDGGDSEIIYELHDDFYPTQGMEIPFNAGYQTIGDVLTSVNKEEQHA